MPSPRHELAKIPTGIAGFDQLAEGGLPKGRAIVVSGTAGSGKTIFGLEFLHRGIERYREGGVFVTFEESRDDLVREVASFGWDLDAHERAGRLAFVDASNVAEHQIEVGEYDFSALAARIRYAIGKAKAKRIVIDSIAALFLRYRDQAVVRRELFRIIAMLRKLDVTAVITAERVNDEDGSSRFGVEDFVADGVVFLYNSAVGRDRERQMEIVKLRGASHQTGRRAFLIGSDGIVAFPATDAKFPKESPTKRLSIGVSGIDAMTDGGIYRGSTTLLKGPSGTGRTVLGIQFLAEGVRRGETGVLFSFEEGRAQLLSDADAIGKGLRGAVRKGLLTIVARQPASVPIEAHLKAIMDHVDALKPKRVVIDSLTALAAAVDEHRFRRFAAALNGSLKARGATTILNYTTGAAQAAAAEADLAVIADNIIVMKLHEAGRSMEREIMVVKARASGHDTEIKRYTITDDGMCVLGAAGDCEPTKRRRRTRGKKR